VGWVLEPEKQSLLEISNAESFRSKRSHAIIWSQTGVIIGDHYLTVPPLQTASIDVAKFLDGGASASAAGTVELRIADSPSAISGWLRMTYAALNKTWSVPETGGYTTLPNHLNIVAEQIYQDLLPEIDQTLGRK
jgi:hypothetical protein